MAMLNRTSGFGAVQQSFRPSVDAVCAHSAVSPVCGRHTETQRHKKSRSAASLTTSPVLSFLSAVLSIIRCYSDTVKLNFRVSHLPNTAAFSGSAWWSRCGQETEPEGSQRDWQASTSQCSVSKCAILPENVSFDRPFGGVDKFLS